MERESEVERPARENPEGEALYHLELLALLNRLVREKGREEAAAELGVDPRTLGGSLDGGVLSRRMRGALEGWLAAKNSSQLARHGERLDALEQQVSALAERDLAGREDLEAAVRAGTDVWHREWGEYARRLEESLLSRLGASQIRGVRGQAEDAPGEAGPAPMSRPRREHPDLVTIEPAPDDAEVFGEAWTRIEEWRQRRRDHPNRGSSLSWLQTEERIRKLEVELLQVHGMTLPPETYPLRGMARDSQLSWRLKTLRDTRKRRIRRQALRWVRDLLTLGIWCEQSWRRAWAGSVVNKVNDFGKWARKSCRGGKSP